MLSLLVRHMEGCDSVLPCVLHFHGSPSSYLWEDSEGVVHEVLQGESGEQGDVLMPALFASGQRDVLVAIQNHLDPCERLMAFLVEIYAVVERPDHTEAVCSAIEQELRIHTVMAEFGQTDFGQRLCFSGMADFGGPPRLAHDSPRTPNVHISRPRSNTTKIPRKPPSKGGKNENSGGRGKKKREKSKLVESDYWGKLNWPKSITPLPSTYNLHATYNLQPTTYNPLLTTYNLQPE